MPRSKTIQSLSPSQGLKIKKEICNELLGRYQYLLLEQIYSWFEGYEKIAWKAVNEMVRDRQLTIIPGRKGKDDLVKMSFVKGDIDSDRLSAFWALIKLKKMQEAKGNAIKVHIPHNQESCIKISFFIEGCDDETQILKVRQGFEQMNVFEVHSIDPDVDWNDEKELKYLPDRFIIIDNEEQIPYIDIPNVISFMKVDQAGSVTMVTK